MNHGKICISVGGKTSAETLETIRQAEEFADLIEVRFDCLHGSEIKQLAEELAIIDKQFLITFRPHDEGGQREIGLAERMKFWDFILSRLEKTDFLVDYEADLDFPLKLNGEKAIVSMHDFAGTMPDLSVRFDTLASLSGKTIKIAIAAGDVTDAIGVWKLLGRASSSNKRIIPIAMGESGKWTRILGLAHGSPITYGSPGEGSETAPGQISGQDLQDVYRVRDLNKETEVFGLIAGDTTYSRSPFMHNAAFKHAGLNSVFVPLQIADLDAFIRRMVKPDTREIELNFKGFSVTNPHKQAIIRYLDSVDETAREIGAVNTVKVEDGKLYGYNTDAAGFIEPLKKMYGDLKRSRVAVVGAGGAARACVYALRLEGADVTVFARDVLKASALAEEFGVRSERLSGNRQVTADILINATPTGTTGGHENKTVATAEELRGVRLVYDLVYNPSETRLLREAKAAGAKTLGGVEMLIAQGAKQFEIWTGREAPIEQMRLAVEERLR